MNLGSAVQVLCYELRMASLAQQEKNNQPAKKRGQETVSADVLEGYFKHLEETLVEIDFLNPENPGVVMRKLRRLYMRSELEQNELAILRGILSDTQRSLKIAANNNEK